MRLLGIALLACCSAWPAVLYRISCAGPGGLDAAGNQWTADSAYYGGQVYGPSEAPGLGTQAIPYRNVRFGLSFYYQIALPNGDYSVTLKLIEPTRTAVKTRSFDIAINGVAVETHYDLYAEAGGRYKPYDETFPVTITGGILKIQFTGTPDNAVVSGIQIEQTVVPPPPPPPPPTAATGAVICEIGFGEPGFGKLFPRIYSVTGCENMTGLRRSVTRVRCRADVDGGAVLDIQARDASGVLKSLLAEPVPCFVKPADVTLPVGSGYDDGDVLYFFVRVDEVANPAITTPAEVVVAAMIISIPPAQ